jgi:hypothetical protein
VVHQNYEVEKNPQGFFDLLHPVRIKQRKFFKNFLLLNLRRDEARRGRLPCLCSGSQTATGSHLSHQRLLAGRMPHLIRDVVEGVWKKSLLSKVIRLETGEDRMSLSESKRILR